MIGDFLYDILAARRAGISPSYLNLIERNQRPLTVQLLLKLASTYKVDPAELQGETKSSVTALKEAFSDPLLAGELPWKDRIVLLSGRASFELLQKAMMAGAPLVAAIGAPSTLAVELAESAGITLVAFLRPGGCNVYCNAWRVAGASRES